MTRPNDRPPAIVSTAHDPDGRLLASVREHGWRLERYAASYVTVTDVTNPILVDALQALGVSVASQPVGAPGLGRRSALEAAITAGHAATFYCDLDRWLHWASFHADELTTLPAQIAELHPTPWYVCIGRSPRAFATHPEVQRVAERATSRAIELVIGRPIDATAGACWLSAEGAAIVLAGSVDPAMSTDLEWPALVHRVAPDRIAGLAVEGLEFETASFHAREIVAAGGLDAWVRRTYDRPDVWRDRLRLAADSVAALARVLADPSPG